MLKCPDMYEKVLSEVLNEWFRAARLRRETRWSKARASDFVSQAGDACCESCTVPRPRVHDRQAIAYKGSRAQEHCGEIARGSQICTRAAVDLLELYYICVSAFAEPLALFETS